MKQKNNYQRLRRPILMSSLMILLILSLTSVVSASDSDPDSQPSPIGGAYEVDESMRQESRNGRTAGSRQQTVSSASANNLLTNGDFETGDFSGWTAIAQTGSAGNIYIDDANGTTPQSGFQTVGPAAGDWYAVTDQTGPGAYALTQSFTLPAGCTTTVSFDMFVNNWAGALHINPAGLDRTVAPNQHARVDILTENATPFDTDAGVLENLYIGDDGYQMPNAYTAYQFDISAAVAAGGTFQLRFAQVDNQFFFNQGVDNVVLEAQCGPPPPTCDVNAAGVNVIHGTPKNDKLKGTPERDIIFGYGGNDRIEGMGGNDCLVGGDGNDQLFGNDGDDIIWGGDVDNATTYNRDNDKLWGGNGDDEMHGGYMDDRLQGDDGDDMMWGDDRRDKLYGNDGNDMMWGGDDRDHLHGNDGNDTMHGGEGDDFLDGDDGDDDLYGNAGRDKMYGGNDNDYMEGGSEDDTMSGSRGYDEMWGGEGRDRIDGGHEDDLLYGEGGDDKLYGGRDNDMLDGGADNDYLDGSRGTDTCTTGERLRSCEL